MDPIYKLYASLPTLPSQKVRTEIDLDALRYNYRLLAARVTEGRDDCLPVCVIKADAYGHGADACATALLEEGCRMFAVSGVEEALAVRRVCGEKFSDAAILILGYTPADEVETLIDNRITQACFSIEYARALSAQIVRSGKNGTLKVHLKFDTGMNRIGFAAHNSAEIERTVCEVREAAALPGIDIDGAFTHFARADEDSETADARTREQARRFLTVTDRVIGAGIPLRMRHICNSAATIRFPEYHLDGCRLGILLYGINPSEALNLPLRPVMKLKTVISQVHTLRRGESVSYGGTFTAPCDMKIATVPIGYADGFIRAYTGARAVIVSPDGKVRGSGTVIGRICMDQCMLDVADCGACEGDSVTLIGEPGQLDDLARRAGTINYECLCLISARVPRIIVDGNEEKEKSDEA